MGVPIVKLARRMRKILIQVGCCDPNVNHMATKEAQDGTAKGVLEFIVGSHKSIRLYLISWSAHDRKKEAPIFGIAKNRPPVAP